MQFFFSRPFYLIFLALIPVIILLHFILLKGKRKYALKFSNFAAISRIKGIELYSKNIVVLLISVLTITLMIFSLSGLTIQAEILTSSFSYVIGIDSSRSMEATDILPSRMEVAKQTAINFVDNSNLGTRIGVISFAGFPLTEQEITNDKLLIKNAIQNTEISSIGGTDISSAIFASSLLLDKEDNKAIILMSDGQINLGNLSETIDYAKDKRIVIHTIAIGLGVGETSYGLSRLDEGSLKSLAYNTGGEFLKAEKLEDFSSAFDKIRNAKIRSVKIDTTYYLIILSIIFIFILYILVNTRYRVFP